MCTILSLLRKKPKENFYVCICMYMYDTCLTFLNLFSRIKTGVKVLNMSEPIVSLINYGLDDHSPLRNTENEEKFKVSTN